MEIIGIKNEKLVEKTKEEMEEELKSGKNQIDKLLVDRFKIVPLKEQMLIIGMTQAEYQLVAFYLELDKRNGVKTDLVLPKPNNEWAKLFKEKNESE